MENETQASRSWIDYIGLVLRGFCMGSADVVPGVSGGTMAFILGIYEELINAIRSINLEVIKLVWAFKFKEVFDRMPWKFLLAVLVGIIGAIFSLAPGLEWLWENEQVLLLAFFFGLIVASVVVVRRRVEVWYGKIWLAAGIACVLAFIIVGLRPSETPSQLWFIFLSGAIAICAMILPGISGSFLLLLMGKYHQILTAVNDRDFVTLGIFALGAGLGLIAFAQLLGWLFKHFQDITVAVLIGFMVGSLRAVWPWQAVVSTMIDRHGQEVPKQLAATLPPEFNGQIVAACGLALFGFALVIILESLAKGKAAT